MTIEQKLAEIEETRSDDSASNETTLYTHQVEWMIDTIVALQKQVNSSKQEVLNDGKVCGQLNISYIADARDVNQNTKEK